jgi:hypothetical protein
MPVDRRYWPPLVQLALLGIHSRGIAWVYVIVTLVLGAAGIVAGFVEPLGFLGGLMLFATLWYVLAIRWVDRNSSWS